MTGSRQPTTEYLTVIDKVVIIGKGFTNDQTSLSSLLEQDTLNFQYVRNGFEEMTGFNFRYKQRVGQF